MRLFRFRSLNPALISVILVPISLLVPSLAYSATPETPSARWAIHSVAEPTSFNAADTQRRLSMNWS